MPENELIKISELSEASDYLDDDYTIIDNGVTSRKIKANKIGGSIDMAEIIEAVYPVGSIYMSISNTNPSELFPGTTWEALRDRFLLGAGNSYNGGAVGGESSVTLTINTIPSHQHSITNYSHQNTPGGDFAAVYANGGTNTGLTGGGQAHNNMPPYLAVYMWKRTA